MNKEDTLGLFDKIKQIGITKAKAAGYNLADKHFFNVTYNGDVFEINFSEPSSGNEYYFEVSLDELEQDIEDILFEQKRKEEERIAKALEAQRHYQAILDKQNKEQEYAIYLRLKQKFENE